MDENERCRDEQKVIVLCDSTELEVRQQGSGQNAMRDAGRLSGR